MSKALNKTWLAFAMLITTLAASLVLATSAFAFSGPYIAKQTEAGYNRNYVTIDYTKLDALYSDDDCYNIKVTTYLYQKKGSGSWKKIKTLHNNGGNDYKYVTVKNLKPNTKYQYKVKSKVSYCIDEEIDVLDEDGYWVDHEYKTRTYSETTTSKAKTYWTALKPYKGNRSSNTSFYWHTTKGAKGYVATAKVRLSVTWLGITNSSNEIIASDRKKKTSGSINGYVQFNYYGYPATATAKIKSTKIYPYTKHGSYYYSAGAPLKKSPKKLANYYES
ncbi:MAG: fibronectin type III domain-containing protein [Eggerthellaceae bacterium]